MVFSYRGRSLSRVSSGTGGATGVTPLDSLCCSKVCRVESNGRMSLALRRCLSESARRFCRVTDLGPTCACLNSILRTRSVGAKRCHSITCPGTLGPRVEVTFSLPVGSEMVGPGFASFGSTIVSTVASTNGSFDKGRSRIFSCGVGRFGCCGRMGVTFKTGVGVKRLFSVAASIRDSGGRDGATLFISFDRVCFGMTVSVPSSKGVFLGRARHRGCLGRGPMCIGSIGVKQGKMVVMRSRRSCDRVSMSVQTTFGTKVMGKRLSLSSGAGRVLGHTRVCVCVVNNGKRSTTGIIAKFPTFRSFVVGKKMCDGRVCKIPVSFSNTGTTSGSVFVSRVGVWCSVY